MKKLTGSLVLLAAFSFSRKTRKRPFRVANDYNVFVFGDIVQAHTMWRPGGRRQGCYLRCSRPRRILRGVE